MGDTIRHIERIEEADDDSATPRSVVVALVVLGGACVFFAALALGGRAAGPREHKLDPLGELLAQRAHAPLAAAAASAAPSSVELTPKDVTFPGLLSDGDHPSTALAAVRGAAHGAADPAPEVQPPPAADRLSVVPLPAQAVLEPSPLLVHPRDPLTKAASDAARVDSTARESGAATPGHEGGYQLQVSSFHTPSEAQAFAEQLRARGHHAYVVEASVPGRGTWWRVRIGPFPNQHAAAEYRATFEDREHVVPFVVLPEPAAKGR